MTGLILFGSFAILLILGVPIAMSLGAAGMVTILFSPNVHLSINVIAKKNFWRARFYINNGNCIFCLGR